MVIEGRGWGHGVGMAQDGALAMGRDGASTADILQHFYPGTSTGQDSGNVRVAVLDGANGEAVVSFPGGGEVRSSRDGSDAPGFPVTVAPGGSVRLRFDGAYRVEPLSGATVAALRVPGATLVEAPGQVTTTQPPPDQAPPEEDDRGPLDNLVGGGNPPPENLPGPPAPTGPPAPPAGIGDAPGGPAAPGLPPPAEAPPPPENVAISGSALWAVPSGGSTLGVPARSARYRGILHAVAGGNGLRLINEVNVEDYLRGMGEVLDSSWPRASLGAQAVVARTYALRAMALGGELCDTQTCQVYLGAHAEYGAMDAAVAATRGTVVLHGGTLAQTVYSASGGGVAATPEEGFGTSGRGLPYLGAVSYPTADPQPWTQRIALAQLGRRFSYPGALTDVRVATTGPSGRALTVELLGDAGSKEVPALAFDDTLGLRSTLWTVRLEVPPAPPQAAGTGTGPTATGGGGWTRARAGNSAVTAGGRLLLSDDVTSAAALAGLEAPLRAVAAMTALVLVLGVWGGTVFGLIARRAPRTAGPGSLMEQEPG
ncbi:MAG TPA: SpoIID/LytB domain-containing protein [Acidimicrobiales bacterium]|nr:SpoIID/LytB domain-containing protein [Acidimicrobiales bacterium]